MYIYIYICSTKKFRTDVQSLRADELADFILNNCIVALNLLDQTAHVQVGGTNSLPHDILPQGLIFCDILLPLQAYG
jgi:hypothetical protein